MCSLVFFFNDTATTEIYTLSLHDALPILPGPRRATHRGPQQAFLARRALRSAAFSTLRLTPPDRKSTRLNSSHANISYAVFCLKQKPNSIPLALHASTYATPHTPSMYLHC